MHSHTLTAIGFGTLVFAGLFSGVASGLDRWNRLPWKKKSAADAAAEIEIRDHVIARLQAERDTAKAHADMLEQTRSLEPVIAQVSSVAAQLAENSKINSQILDRLVHHNGSFKAIHDSLRIVTDALLRMQPVSPNGGTADVRRVEEGGPVHP